MNTSWAEALARLPHGPEFRFIDRLVELEPGKSGAGEYTVRGDEPFLRGHFPGQPIFPGVLLVEAGAQLAGTVAQCAPGIPPLRELRLTGLRSIKITGTANPGQIIRVEAKITARLGGLIQAEVSATVHGHQVMRGEVVLSGEP